MNGTTAESPTLEPESELLEVTTTEFGDEALIIAGTGSNSTKKTIESTEQAKLGRGRGRRCSLLNSQTKRPARSFQSGCGRGGHPNCSVQCSRADRCKLELETILELAEHPRIVGIKEASEILIFSRR